MEITNFHGYRSHGDGTFRKEDFHSLGDNVIFESDIMVFHPEKITIGNNVYIGHRTILRDIIKTKW